MTLLRPEAIGRALNRTEGGDKVTGRARYAYEYDIDHDSAGDSAGEAAVAYVWPVQSVIARGSVVDVDDGAARAAGAVAVLWHANAPRVAESEDAELQVFQSAEVSYRGQLVAAVVAESLEAAREAASLVQVRYRQQKHQVELSATDPQLYAPAEVNPGLPTDTATGSIEDAITGAVHVVDRTYRTPPVHNNPMEPHATIARWQDGRLTVWDSNQAPSEIASSLSHLFSLEPDQVHVITEHVGGGFGSKGSARPIVVLASMAALVAGRPVKLAATRQAMFSLVGYRTPTIQHVRLAADENGRLLGLSHETVEQTSRVFEFAEQTGEVSRHMYATPASLVTHRLARLDVPTPRWMRAPGECPGMYALESAMDELALAAQLDPIELRARNEPAVDPSTGEPFTSRQYLQCLHEGARRFGWADRPRGEIRRGRRMVGFGVAGSTYPVNMMPTSAQASVDAEGRFTISTAVADIGQGGRTVLGQIAADALGVDLDRVTVRIGDSLLPKGSVAGGSSGTSSWGWAVTKACQALLAEMRDGVPAEGLSATADISDELAARPALPQFAYGAQFIEVEVDADTAEVRVARALGVFAAGRIINPTLARSQLIGGMTMGVSMALHEESVLDPQFGDFVNHDFAEYHIAVNADIDDIQAYWLPELDEQLSPAGGKGIGEIGIVGTAAAVANAVYDAVGYRVRSLPIRPDKLLDATTRLSLTGR
jgi:xanthine dehydrogenase YagR molybdenum-binding subunit